MIPAVEIERLTVVFPQRGGNLRALDDLNLVVAPGQVFGFLGPNGAGKTTTMHVLLGFLSAEIGEARIFGDNVRRHIARQRIGYLPEHPDTYRFLTGRELLTLAARLFRLRPREARRRIADLLHCLDMRDAADRRIQTYSRGMLQRICLAQSLVNDPDLVILDEPTGGLDPLGRMTIRNVIANLRSRGKTVFFSSHELSEVELVCDHLAILARGRIVVEGRASEIVPPGQRLETFFLETLAAERAPNIREAAT